MQYDILIIGAGAAGMMAAIHAAEEGKKTAIIEKNARPGRKIYITGKGRCNVTNDCSADEVLKHVPQNGRFLYASVNSYPPESVKEFFTKAGVKLKTERGNRVFPESDKAADIIDALTGTLKKRHIPVIQATVQDIRKTEDGAFLVTTQNGEYRSEKLILATGGMSYPLTGSTGDGYRFAQEFGHSVTPLRPSLIPIEIAEEDCVQMQGLSLKNVTLKLLNQKNKVLYKEQGEMLFTHFGISGPRALSASAYVRDMEKNSYTVSIDLKPALDEQTLNARILRDFAENQNKNFENVLYGLLPKLMVPVIMKRLGIPDDLKVNSVTKQQRLGLVEILKNLQFHISGLRPIEEAIITSGGISVKEINPKTMESKIVKGLYFAGEIIDVDAFTGGFNLQIAWSTGRAAGYYAARKEEEL